MAVPDLSGREEEYVVQAIRDTWISSTGAFVDRFEREFSGMCGRTRAISVSNGTAALHLALIALGVGPGDEVIVPSLTYVATANAIRYVGAEPVFVDVDPATWCLDPTRIEERLTPMTLGILPVHLYGHVADMDAINEIAATHGLWVVEDAAEAHFARYKGRLAGSLSTIAAFSFFGNKIVTCGEGGALVLDDPELAAPHPSLPGPGDGSAHRYYFPVTGYNFRLTNVACALLCAQLERAEEIVARRREIFAAYRALLTDVPGIGLQPVASWCEPAPWLFSVTVDPVEYGRTRDELIRELVGRGIASRPFFVPLHTLPPFRRESRHRGDHLPETTRLGATGLNLPTFAGLDEAGVEWVPAAVRNLARSGRIRRSAAA